MSIKVLTDSSCDLPDEILSRFNIGMVPLRVSFENGETFLDRVELSPAAFMAKMASFKTLPKTSTPDPAMMMDALAKGLTDYDQVLFISLSSALSCTFQTACLGCEMLESDRIRVFDSLTISLGTGIMVIKAAQMAEQGFNLDEIMEQLALIRANSETVFTLDTLDNIVKGGRLKKYEGITGNLLGIKPILKPNDLGQVEVVEKVRGRKKALNHMLDMIGEYAGESISGRMIGVSHASCLAEAQHLAHAIKERYHPREEVIISEIGATIGTYAGEGGILISL